MSLSEILIPNRFALHCASITTDGGGPGSLVASDLATTTLPVNVSLATAPTTNQTLIASSATTATWGLVANANVSASAGIVDTKLATISTAGKVSNSATTATNTNTINTIVSRDPTSGFGINNVAFGLSAGVYPNITMTTGNTNGYIWSNLPAIGDGIHWSYNFIYPGGGLVPFIANAALGTIDIRLNTTSIAFGVGAVNTAPTTYMTLTGTASPALTLNNNCILAGPCTQLVTSTANTPVSVNSTTPAGAGYALISTSGTVATWQTILSQGTSANTPSTLVARSAAGLSAFTTVSLLDLLQSPSNSVTATTSNTSHRFVSTKTNAASGTTSVMFLITVPAATLGAMSGSLTFSLYSTIDSATVTGNVSIFISSIQALVGSIQTLGIMNSATGVANFVPTVQCSTTSATTLEIQVSCSTIGAVPWNCQCVFEANCSLGTSTVTTTSS